MDRVQFRLLMAIEYNRIAEVQVLLQRMHPVDDALARRVVERAAKLGHHDIFTYFLKHDDIQVTDLNRLQFAVATADMTTVQQLMDTQLELLDEYARRGLFHDAVYNGNWDIITFLCNAFGLLPHTHELLHIAIANQDFAEVQRLAQLPHTQAGYQHLRRAVRTGNLEMIQYLVTLPTMNPTHSHILGGAGSRGYHNIVEFLLSLPGVHPSNNENIALYVTCFGRQMEIFQRLLSVPGVDVKAHNHIVLHKLTENNLVDFIVYVLETYYQDTTLETTLRELVQPNMDPEDYATLCARLSPNKSDIDI